MRTPLAEQRRLVEALRRDPGHLDDGPAELIETHFSWVILTRRYAFKCKKALRHAWLPHDTPADRRRACRTELHLNRRLAPTVYLGVVPLQWDKAGGVARATAATACEYAVQMHRLADADCLEWQIDNARASRADIVALAERLSRFYAGLPPERPAPAGHWHNLMQSMREWSRELRARADAGPAAAAAHLHEQLAELGGELRATIEERVRLGRIREAHGDLRPAHVYFLPAPVVIDCLEFSRPLRLLDPVDELAFLAMECRRQGADWVGRCLAHTYQAHSGDQPPRALWLFHAGRRTLLWALLALRHLDRAEAGDGAIWQHRAADYLALGQRILDELEVSAQAAESAWIPRAIMGATATRDRRSASGRDAGS